MDQVPGWLQEVLQSTCFSHRDIPGVGFWSSHSRTWLLCAIYSSGKNNNKRGLHFVFNSAFSGLDLNLRLLKYLQNCLMYIFNTYILTFMVFKGKKGSKYSFHDD